MIAKHLYIARMKNEPYFKFGISSNVHVRLSTLPYDFYMEEVMVLKCRDERLAAYKEALLKELYVKDHKRFEDKPGHTETRSMDRYPEYLMLIQNWCKTQPGIELEKRNYSDGPLLNENELGLEVFEKTLNGINEEITYLGYEKMFDELIIRVITTQPMAQNHLRLNLITRDGWIIGLGSKGFRKIDRGYEIMLDHHPKAYPGLKASVKRYNKIIRGFYEKHDKLEDYIKTRPSVYL